MEAPHNMSSNGRGGTNRFPAVKRLCIWTVFIGTPWIILLLLVGEWYVRHSIEPGWESAREYTLVREKTQEEACDRVLKTYGVRDLSAIVPFDEQVRDFALRDDEGRGAWAESRHELAVVCDFAGLCTNFYVPANEPELASVADALEKDRYLADSLYLLYVDKSTALTPEQLYQTMNQNRTLDFVWPQQLCTGSGDVHLFQIRLRPLDVVQHERLGLFVRRSIWEEWGQKYRPLVDWTDGFEWPAPELLTRQFRTNRFGFRGEDVAVPKPAGVVRIVCIGSSMTVEGPTDELTYPHILQNKLRAHFGTDRIEVVNAGNHGSVSANDLARASDFLALQPDMIVHYGFGNDLRAMCIHDWNEASLLKSRPGMLLKLCLRHSLLVFKYANWALVPSRHQIAPEYERLIFTPLRQLGRFFTEKGVDMMFCTVACPATDGLSAKERDFFDFCIHKWNYNQYYLDSRGYERMLQAYNDKLKEMSKETGASVIDASADLSHHPECFADIFHMNAAGLERKADAVFQQVRDRVAVRLAAIDPATGSRQASAHAE